MLVKLVSNKRELKRFVNYNKGSSFKTIVTELKYNKLAELVLSKKKFYAIIAQEGKEVKGKLIFGFVSDKFNKSDNLSCYFSNLKYEDEITLQLMLEMVFVEMKKYGVKTIKGALQPFNIAEDYGIDEKDECNLILGKMGFEKEKSYYAISTSNFELTQKASSASYSYTIKNFDIMQKDNELTSLLNILSKDKFKEETVIVSQKFLMGVLNKNKLFNFKHIKIAYDMLGNAVGFIIYVFEQDIKGKSFVKGDNGETVYVPLLCSKLNGGYIDMCEKLLDEVKKETQSRCSKLVMLKLPQAAIDKGILKILDAEIVAKNEILAKNILD